MSNPLLSVQHVFGGKIESVLGTAEALTATEAAFNVFDAKITADIKAIRRRGQATASDLPSIPGARAGSASFKTELVGDGSGTPSALDLFLLGCGFAAGSGGVYAPVTGSSTAKTLTLGHWLDGSRFKSIKGACGNVKFVFKSGEPVMCEWDFKGCWVAPTTAAMVAPAYPTVMPPRFAGAAFTIGGTSRVVSEMEIDLGNSVVIRQDATNASGYLAAVVADRQVKVTITLEAEAYGTKDWWADHLASTEAALACTVGSDSGNTFAFACPKLQIMDPPDDDDADGVSVHKLTFQANRSASAGDDELTVTAS